MKVDLPPEECLSLAVAMVRYLPLRRRFWTRTRRPSRAGLTTPDSLMRAPASGVASLTLNEMPSAFFLAGEPSPPPGPPLGGLEVGGEPWGGPLGGGGLPGGAARTVTVPVMPIARWTWQ